MVSSISSHAIPNDDFTETLKNVPSLKIVRIFSSSSSSSSSNNKRSSPLVIEFKNKLNGNFYSNGMVEIDSDFNKVHSSFLGLIYEQDENKKVELRSVYKRLRPSINNMPWFDNNLPISQMELLAQWSLSDRLMIFGRIALKIL